MNKLAYFLILLFVCHSSYSAKFNLVFSIDGNLSLKQRVFVSIISFENSPEDENIKVYDEFLLIDNLEREFQVPNKHKSLKVIYYAKNETGAEIIRRELYKPISEFQSRPAKNLVQLSFFQETDNVDDKVTLDEFRKFLLQTLSDEERGGLVDDNSINLDSKIKVGSLLFIKKSSGQVTRYDLEFDDSKVAVQALDSSNFQQHELIDLRNSTGVKLSGNFPGVYAGLDVALQNSKLLEYQLSVTGYKRVSISNFQDDILRLLETPQHPFVRNIYDELNKLESEEDLLDYQLHFISSIHQIDKIELKNKSYKEVKLTSEVDLNVHSLIQLDGNLNTFSEKSFETVLDKSNFYLRYSVTDFSGLLINSLNRFQDASDKDDALRKLTLYQSLKDEHIDRFNDIFRRWLRARFQSQYQLATELFPSEDHYFERATAVSNLLKLDGKLISPEIANDPILGDTRIRLENSYFDQIRKIALNINYLDILIIKYDAIANDISIDSDRITPVIFQGNTQITEVRSL